MTEIQVESAAVLPLTSQSQPGHTPGPWTASFNGYFWQVEPVCAPGVYRGFIATIPHYKDDGTPTILPTEAARNAALIESAPAMLVVLEMALKVVDSHRRATGGDGDLTAAAIRAVLDVMRSRAEALL